MYRRKKDLLTPKKKHVTVFCNKNNECTRMYVLKMNSNNFLFDILIDNITCFILWSYKFDAKNFI